MATKRPLHKTPDTILVIQTAFLGDIVLTTPFLESLREKFPAATIHFVTTPAGEALLEPNPWKIQFIAYDKRGKDSGVVGFLRMVRKLRSLKAQRVYCIHRSFRSALLAKATGAQVWGFSESSAPKLMDKKFSRAKFEHEVEKNHSLLELPTPPPFPKLFLTEEDKMKSMHLIPQEPFVAMAVSSVWATKRWPEEKFASLAHKLSIELGMQTVLIGSKEDQVVANRVMEVFRSLPFAGRPEPLNLAGQTNLGMLKAILAKSQLTVSNDSSPLHMAAAMGRPVVGIFGPTTKEIGFFPFAPIGKSAVAEVKGLSCRPCGLHGHDACPLGHFKCMKDLDSQSVFDEVKKLICL